MDKEKFKKSFKGCLPYLVAAIAIVALLVAVYAGCMVKNAASEMNAMTEAWRTDMAKSVAMLSSKISAVEKEFDSFRTDFDESIAGATFEVEAYPVKYAFTEQSAEEFKSFVLAEQLPAMKTAYKMSDEEYEQTVTATAELTPEQIMSSYGMDSVALGIELVDETVARIGGLDGVYNVQDGTIYADGYYFGTIDDDKIVYTQNNYGIPMTINFYREESESTEMSVVDKINVIESRIRSVSAQLVDFRERMSHYESELGNLTTVADDLQVNLNDAVEKCEGELNNLTAVTDGLRDDLNDAVEKYDGLKEDVASMETFHEEIAEFGQNVENRVAELESFHEEIAEFGQNVESRVEEIESFNEEIAKVGQDIEARVEVLEASHEGNSEIGQDVETRIEDLEAFSEEAKAGFEELQGFVEEVYEYPEYVDQGFEEVGAMFEEVGAYVLDLEDRIETLEVYSDALREGSDSVQNLAKYLDDFSNVINMIKGSYNDVVDGLSDLKDRVGVLENLAASITG